MPAAGTSPCPCSDVKQSLALVHSRLDTMVTAIEATNAKVDLLNRQVNATKSESAKANSDITSATQMLINKVDGSDGQLTTLTTKMDTGLAQMASIDATLVNNGASSAVAQTQTDTAVSTSPVRQTAATSISDNQGQEHVVARFTGVAALPSWSCGGVPDEIVITVDQPICVTGFTLYGGWGDSTDGGWGDSTVFIVEGQLRLTRSGQVLATSGHFQLHTDGSEVTFPVKFRTAADVTPGVQYTVRVTMTGNGSWCGHGGKASVTSSSGVTFTFMTSTTQGCSSHVDCGQIPEITFFTR